MAMGTDNNVSDKSPGTVKSDPKESDEESQLQGEGSLLELIVSTRKALFERPPPTDEDQTVTSRQSQKWVPIKKATQTRTLVHQGVAAKRRLSWQTPILQGGNCPP